MSELLNFIDRVEALEGQSELVAPKPYSEWSTENVYEDPLESRVRFGDYIREQYINADSYTPEVEQEISMGFATSLRDDGLLLEDGSNIDEINARSAAFDGRGTFDQQAKYLRDSLSYEDPEWQTLTDYLAAAKVADPTEEYLKTVQRLKSDAEQVLSKNHDRLLEDRVLSGEIPIAKLSSGELVIGDSIETMGLSDAVKSSAGAGVTMRDALRVQQLMEIPDGFRVPRYKLERVMEIHAQLREEVRLNNEFQILTEGLAMREAGTELDLGDRLERGAMSTLGRIFKGVTDVAIGSLAYWGGKIRGKSLDEISSSDVVKRLEEGDKADQREAAVRGARGTDINELAARYAAELGYNASDVLPALRQVVLEEGVDKGIYKYHKDEEELGKNIRTGGYGLPHMPTQLYLNKDLFEAALDQRPDLSDSAKDRLSKQRVYQLKSRFQSANDFLRQTHLTDEWQQALMAGHAAGMENYEILEEFLTDEDNWKETWERTKGIGMSLVDAGGTLIAAIPAIGFENEVAMDYLATIPKRKAKQREMAKLFGDEFGFWQEAMETTFPLLTDIAATALLTVATAPAGGVGGVAYLGAKSAVTGGASATAKFTVRGLGKALTTNLFRTSTAGGVREQAKKILGVGAAKGTAKPDLKKQLVKAVDGEAGVDSVVDLLNAYNGKLANVLKIGPTRGIFITSGMRSGGSTYGVVYNQLLEQGVSKEDAHDRALGAGLQAATFTGLLTASFSKIGMGGLESALMRGLSYKQMKAVSEVLKGRLRHMPDKVKVGAAQTEVPLFDKVKESLATLMKKHSTVAGPITGVAKSIAHEGFEEGIDEFVNVLFTDAALHEHTPMIERMEQTFRAAALGGVMGGSVPLIRGTARILRADPYQMQRQASFVDAVINETVSDLEKSDAPKAAQAIRDALAERGRKDTAREAAAAAPPAIAAETVAEPVEPTSGPLAGMAVPQILNEAKAADAVPEDGVLTETQKAAIDFREALGAEPAAEPTAELVPTAALLSMSREELVEHYASYGLPEGMTAYDALTTRPELRGKSTAEVLAYYKSREAEARAVTFAYDTVGDDATKGTLKLNKDIYYKSASGWEHFTINKDTHKKGGPRHKTYVTFGVDEVLDLTQQEVEAFIDTLQKRGYNGQFKHSPTGARFITKFDNFVMHGATKADAELGGQIAKEIFGDRVTINSGVDPAYAGKAAKISHTEELAAALEGRLGLTKGQLAPAPPESAQLDLFPEDTINPTSIKSAMSQVLAEETPVVSGADPATVRIKGALMSGLGLNPIESSSVENSDHQAVRELATGQKGESVEAKLEPLADPKVRIIIDPERTEEAKAVEARFREQVKEINQKREFYQKLSRDIEAQSATGTVPAVQQALDKAVQEGRAVSPEAAKALTRQAFRDRITALKEFRVKQEIEVEEEPVAPAEETAIERLIESGYPHILTAAKLRRLGVPVSVRTLSDQFLEESTQRIADQIAARFPVIPQETPSGGASVPSYGPVRAVIDANGVGRFNNDPASMLGLIEQGAPVEVPVEALTSPTLNPAFRFARIGNKFVVSDIVVPESGGLVSALTSAEHALNLREDHTGLSALIRRVTDLREAREGEPDAPEGLVELLITSPFNPDEKITYDEAMSRVSTDEELNPFLPTLDSGDLTPALRDTALIELKLRAQESLMKGEPVSLVAVGREVTGKYMEIQATRLKHQKETYVATIALDEASNLQNNPDFAAAEEISDPYTPYPQEALPQLPVRKISNMIKEMQSDAVAAMAADPALRRDVLEIIQSQVYASSSINFSKMTNKEAWGLFVQWMAQGNNRANSASLTFQRDLKSGKYEMGTAVRQALQIMSLSSQAIEGDPKTDPVYRGVINDRLRELLGQEPDSGQTDEFISSVQKAAGDLYLRSQPTSMTRAEVQAENLAAIAALGLETGNPDSIIEALRRIIGVSDRAETDYDAHLVALARLLIQNPSFINDIAFTIDETGLEYAGRLRIQDDGTRAISININGYNPRGVADTLLHELTHAYVSGITRKPEAELTRQERSALRTLEGLIARVKDQFAYQSSDALSFTGGIYVSTAFDNHDPRVYEALENTDEFIAHFLTSTEFQQAVKVLSDPARAIGTPRSMFQRIVDAILGLFNIQRTQYPQFRKAFSAVLDLSHAAVFAGRPSTRREVDMTFDEFAALQEEGLSALKTIPARAKSFIANAVFPAAPVIVNTSPKRRLTADNLASKVAEEVSNSRNNGARLASALQGATGLDVAQQRRREAVKERYAEVARRLSPPEVEVVVDETLDGMAEVDSESGVMRVNPEAMFNFIESIVLYNGGEPVPVAEIIGVVLNEEHAHAASVAVISEAEINVLIDQLTEEDAMRTINDYGGGKKIEETREKMRRGFRDNNRAVKLQIVEEMLRQHAQRVIRGFTTEESVLFLAKNPGARPMVTRYFKSLLNRMGSNKTRKQFTPQLQAAITRIVAEIRGMEAGYVYHSNMMAFDPNNPTATLEQLRKQLGMNKSLEPYEEPRRAAASGLGPADIPYDPTNFPRDYQTGFAAGVDLDIDTIVENGLRNIRELGTMSEPLTLADTVGVTTVDPAMLGGTGTFDPATGEDYLTDGLVRFVAARPDEGSADRQIVNGKYQRGASPYRAEIIISNIFVPRHLRGQGVGQALMEEIIKRADDSGVTLTIQFPDSGGKLDPYGPAKEALAQERDYVLSVKGMDKINYFRALGFTEFRISDDVMIEDPEAWIEEKFESWKEIIEDELEEEISWRKADGTWEEHKVEGITDPQLMHLIRQMHSDLVDGVALDGLQLWRPPRGGATLKSAGLASGLGPAESSFVDAVKKATEVGADQKSVELNQKAAQKLIDEKGVTMNRDLFLAIDIRAGKTQNPNTTIHEDLKISGIISKKDYEDGRGLVYGDGTGGASKALGADSFEPFPPDTFTPTYTGDRAAGQGDSIDKQYPNILNTFVLNVVEPQTREFILKDIANHLEVGGEAVVVTRGKDVAGGAAPFLKFGELEVIRKKSGELTYQKGFNKEELKTYAEETLGEGFTVTIPTGSKIQKKGRATIVITKNKNVTLDNPPLTGGAALGSGLGPVTKGIYINDGTQSFTEQILNGEKTIETRSRNTLKSFLGQRVGIIRSGKSPVVVVGYATIGDEPIVYPDIESFRADEDKHLVKEGSKFDTKGKKYGYVLSDVVREPNPYPISKKGNRQYADIQPPRALGSGLMPVGETVVAKVKGLALLELSGWDRGDPKDYQNFKEVWADPSESTSRMGQAILVRISDHLDILEQDIINRRDNIRKVEQFEEYESFLQAGFWDGNGMEFDRMIEGLTNDGVRFDDGRLIEDERRFVDIIEKAWRGALAERGLEAQAAHKRMMGVGGRGATALDRWTYKRRGYDEKDSGRIRKLADMDPDFANRLRGTHGSMTIGELVDAIADKKLGGGTLATRPSELTGSYGGANSEAYIDLITKFKKDFPEAFDTVDVIVNPRLERAYYSYGGDAIHLSDGESLSTIAHEIVHALSTKKLWLEVHRHIRNPKGELYLKSLRKIAKTGKAGISGDAVSQPVRELIDLYLHVIDQGGAAKTIGGKVSRRNPDPTARAGFNYALGNLDEFIAQAFMDPQFQRELATIKVERGDRSAWDSFVEIIQRILGFEPGKNTALTEVLSIGESLFRQQDYGRGVSDFMAGRSQRWISDYEMGQAIGLMGARIPRDALGQIEDLSLAPRKEQTQKGADYWIAATKMVGARLTKADKIMLEDLGSDPNTIAMHHWRLDQKEGWDRLMTRIRDKARVLREQEVAPYRPSFRGLKAEQGPARILSGLGAVEPPSDVNNIVLYRGSRRGDPNALSGKHDFFISSQSYAGTYGATAAWKTSLRNPKYISQSEWLDSLGSWDYLTEAAKNKFADDLVAEGHDSVVANIGNMAVVYIPESKGLVEASTAETGLGSGLGPELAPFGEPSDLPVEFRPDLMDFDRYIRLLEIPVVEAGPYKRAGKFMSMFVGDTDPVILRLMRQRDNFIKSSGDVLDNFHADYRAALTKEFGEDIPPEDDEFWRYVQKATGTTDNVQVDPELVESLHQQKVAAKIQADIDFRNANRGATEEQKIENGLAQEAEIERINNEFESRMTAARMAAVEVIKTERNQSLQYLKDNHNEIYKVVLNVRALTDSLSDAAKQAFGQHAADIGVKFDTNMGIYITRRYEMFSDPSYVGMILEADTQEAINIRMAAIEYMRDFYIGTTAKSIQAKAEAEGEPISTDAARVEAEAQYNAQAVGTQSLGEVMMIEFLRSFDTATGASDFGNAFELADAPASIVGRGQNGLSALVENLQGRSEIPEPLANLMGANNLKQDSIDNLLYSFGLVARIAAHQSFLNAVKAQGVEGGWLFSAKEYNRKRNEENFDPKLEYKKIAADKADDGLNPLAGMYTSPEIYEDLKIVFQQKTRSGNDAATQGLNKIMEHAHKLTGYSMGAKTLLSIGFYVRNMLSNVLFFGPAQGYNSFKLLKGSAAILIPGYQGGEYGAKGMLKRAISGTKAETDSYLSFLQGLGVFGNEIRSELMIRLMRGEETMTSVQEKLNELSKVINDKKTPASVAREAKNMAARVASAMDSFYKIGYFENERAIIEEAAETDPEEGKYRNMSASQRDKLAADIVTATAQSYDRAPPIIKKITSGGIGLLLAPFIRFTADIPRISANTMKQIRKELADSNSVIKRRGVKRLVGFTSVVGVFSMVVPTLLRTVVSGIGEEEDEALRESLPSYLKNHTFFYFKAGGKLRSLDLTYMNPFSVLVDPTMRFTEHLFRGEPIEGFEKLVTTAIFDPYLGDQIFAGAVFDVKENRDAATDKPIVEDTDPFALKTGKRLMYVLKEAYGPRTPAKVIEASKAAIEGGHGGGLDSPLGMILSEGLPVVPRVVDPARQFERSIYAMRDEYTRARQRYNELLQNDAMLPSEAADLYIDTRDSLLRLNGRLHRTLTGFRKFMSDGDMYRALRSAKYGDRRVQLAFAGYGERYLPNPVLTERLMQTERGKKRLDALLAEAEKDEQFIPLPD